MKHLLPEHYTEISEPFYKGRGNHSVSTLEQICEDYKEYSHQSNLKLFALYRGLQEINECFQGPGVTNVEYVREKLKELLGN